MSLVHYVDIDSSVRHTDLPLGIEKSVKEFEHTLRKQVGEFISILKILSAAP
ncbi:MAG: hypothetical protein R6W69_14275 [Anaerolineales bacterium]